jgi:alkyldihydroxyacetonephosphate synthase
MFMHNWVHEKPILQLALEKLKTAFDPNGIMNFGTIYYQEEGHKFQQ